MLMLVWLLPRKDIEQCVEKRNVQEWSEFKIEWQGNKKFANAWETKLLVKEKLLLIEGR
jgi:transposase